MMRAGGAGLRSREGEPSRRGLMKTNYVLIDYENVQVKSLALLAGEHFRVRLFLGVNDTRLPSDLVLAMHALGDRASYVKLDAGGANALDFLIAYTLGRLAAAEPEAFFHVISKDRGFDPLIRHLRAAKIFAARSESIEAMPCFRPAAEAGSAGIRSMPEGPAKPDGSGLDALVQTALEDLVKRKTSRPRKSATLRSTVQARLGKDAADQVDAVIAALVRAGHVCIEADKVTYRLPH
jgi:hypothetical protein